MKNNSIYDIMKQVLIGKELKYCASFKEIRQPYNVVSKKHKSVTQKQLEGGNPRFVKTTERIKVIGHYRTYEISKVVDVTISYGDWDGGNTLNLILENGRSELLEVDTIIQEIDNNVIMLKY